MALNPAIRPPGSNPIERANPINDPTFQANQGYNTFDITNQQLITPRYGEVTPTEVCETVLGDRHFVHDNALTMLNQIDASLVTKVNEYRDHFYVPMRCVYPINYEKLIPNPTKGDDLPSKALPMIPLSAFLYRMLKNPQPIEFFQGEYTGEPAVDPVTYQVNLSTGTFDGNVSTPFGQVVLNQLLYVATILSRGQLLDYLGFQPDTIDQISRRGDSYSGWKSEFQQKIDAFFDALTICSNPHDPQNFFVTVIGTDITDNADGFNTNYIDASGAVFPGPVKVRYTPSFSVDDAGQLVSTWNYSSFRAALMDSIEKGLFVTLRFYNANYQEFDNNRYIPEAKALYDFLVAYLNYSDDPNAFQDDVTPVDMFDPGYINPTRLVAYQLAVAEYMSNDNIDNVFTADLWMQNCRSIMFPSKANITSELTFNYNGIDVEYDLMTSGAWQLAFFDDRTLKGLIHRMLPFASNLFLLRRSLRYGDYFSTGRPDLVSVGQLGINVDDGVVNPIEVSQQLLLARYRQATNWMGSKFDSQAKGVYGVTPSDQGARPYFIAHRKIELQREQVVNTAQNQGARTTNLLGVTDSNGFDVFIDDFGILISVVSYDALPAYPSGIDPTFRLYDRYSMFNPMLQNVGDQPIHLDEFTGVLDDNRSLEPFAYSVRYAQYKFGISRAHGAFVNLLPGYAMRYPWHSLVSEPGQLELKISPDFIRDKPYYFDQFFKQRTGLSPASYYHFIVSCNNEHIAARKMQVQPGLLF